ncbi:UTP--glucose-1-phosphate uridylyltransferase [Roseibacterium elongatum DSM 19469]|uniref:UTP--glucose-1-phosphate uridylyltransferase n=1 Tax=Roseicyclus elongatus DSM 19469 TaxID=1294273 RepID=W8RVZ0_9RHOB|nr:UTP--glucose-1-phosphate uridylyltransferase [Roseibacterium elongatum]AHM05438.1 UTP--glucose-1-phosphate uridylyltransferase [Roseibacterium elongatum DSM 19469]
MTHIRKAVFPVAGMGTRLLPATKSVPKEMITLIDRPIIQYAVDEARAAGIEEFIFVSSAGKSALEDYFDTAAALERHLADKGKHDALEKLACTRMEEGKMSILRQDRPRGLGHAVRLARRLIGDEPFAVLLPDDVLKSDVPVLRQMIDAHADLGGHMVATMAVPKSETRNYGVLDVTSERGGLFRARGLVEKPAPERAPSRQAVVGRYILAPSIFAQLDRIGPGAGGELQLTDAINADTRHAPVHGLQFEGTRFDCGSKAGYVKATVAFALDHPDLARAIDSAVAGRAPRQDLAA